MQYPCEIILSEHAKNTYEMDRSHARHANTCYLIGDIVTLEHKNEHNVGWYVQDATQDYMCTT